ncbi:hypothetical protein MVEG_08665 [Podila verticillata NRRL 6337]|nr:hypothetical protein MVEG_08665 [Podila verticillata NRRL 6337]
MTTFILDIPHVTDHIVCYLPAADLLNCLCLNRAWHDALIPHLWRDVVTFRTRGGCSDERTWTYFDCFNTESSRRALRKYAHLIRALTCYGGDLLLLLVESGCVPLSEICFMIDSQGPKYEEDNSDDIQTQDSASLHDLRGPNQERTVNDILYQRLDLINWSSVHTLKLSRRGERPSDRGLSTSTATVGLGAAPWPGRRSEKEHRYMGVYFDDSVAILLNNGVLEIILPYPIMCEAVLPL